MIARCARRRGILVLFKQTRTLPLRIPGKLLTLFRRRLAIAVNDLAQNALVHAQLTSQEVLPNRAAKSWSFKFGYIAWPQIVRYRCVCIGDSPRSNRDEWELDNVSFSSYWKHNHIRSSPSQ